MIGTNVICPGQIRSFLCTSVDESNISWNLSTSSNALFFTQNDRQGEPILESPSGDAVAYLVVQQLENGTKVGNWTSVLHYLPAASTNGSVTISCMSGNNECGRAEVLVYGKYCA